MKKKCLKEWVKALRSGDYLGTSGALRNEVGYCPLGVLCDLSKLAVWEPEPNSKKFQYLGQINYLPKEVAKWAGMSDQERKEVTAYMIAYTDSQRLSLSEIADLLLEKYKPLPKNQ